ncbi:juvenile hormone esterase-like [Ostrinia nubilalis]|uniref:juvenile hormone esterase-like n=1 Tax=Ostrinia nubilalis TaxID=29057 RepID=UPI0030825839
MSAAKLLLVALVYFSACHAAIPDLTGCEVAAKTEQGYVCGRIRNATNGAKYASFRGMEYGTQPLGELRFKELLPPPSFDGLFDATEAGPICAQVDVFYTPNNLVAPLSSGEDCIRINVHVPYDYLPAINATSNSSNLLPVLFWIHGGSFSYGSGDADVHGPEYLMTKDVILVTINYRLHVFGFLSLDNEYIPGNNGLRDCITALKWVQSNIRNFGGDPGQVTIAGQSAGGAMASLLSISHATQGLFQRVVGLSGEAIASFYSYSQTYAKLINAIFLPAAGINPLQTPKKIYEDLVAAPLENLLAGNKVLLDTFGLVSFTPVIESAQPNFTTVIPASPEDLLNAGAGKNYPMWIGFCSNEAADFKTRLEEVNIETKLRLLPSLTLPQNLLFSANALTVPVLTVKQLAEYFNVTFITLEKFLVAATDSYYKYPGQRLTLKRLRANASNTYLSEFSYPGENNISVLKDALNQTWSGAAHVEDLTYFFRFNHFLGPQQEDELASTSEANKMRAKMTGIITNFVINGSPASSTDWPATGTDLKFQNLDSPDQFNFTDPTPYMEDKITYFSNLYNVGGLGSV